MAIKITNMQGRRIHFTHVARMRKLYKEGYSVEEIALTYKIDYYSVKNLMQGLKQPERI